MVDWVGISESLGPTWCKHDSFDFQQHYACPENLDFIGISTVNGTQHNG